MDLTKVRLMKPTLPLCNCKLYGVATKCLHDIPYHIILKVGVQSPTPLPFALVR